MHILNYCKACFQKKGQIYHKKLASRVSKDIPRVKAKRCPKCGETKPVAEFYKSVGKVDGCKSVCKDCESKRAATYKRKVADREFSSIETTGKKKCCICHRILPKNKFNYCRSNYDGLTSHCRGCGLKYKQEHYEENYADSYSRCVEYRRRYPERRRAHQAVSEAVKRGELIRPDTCSKCGKKRKIIGHHNDYDNPLDILWLCISCSRQIHADRRRRR